MAASHAADPSGSAEVAALKARLPALLEVGLFVLLTWIAIGVLDGRRGLWQDDAQILFRQFATPGPWWERLFLPYASPARRLVGLPFQLALWTPWPLTVLYDGRPDAESNWHETTGVARWDGIRLVADDEDPVASPFSDGAWRYASAVPLPDGRTRFYVEAARADGAHDLVTLVR